MPIVQVRASKESQYLTAPFPPVPNLGSVVREWQQPGWNSELLVYPGGYRGNVSPQAWRSAANYLLHVADDGERAKVLAAGMLPAQEPLSELMTKIEGATPDEIQAIGSLATVGPENKTVFISSALTPNRLAIGGVVLHANTEELALLQGLFPEIPVQIPAEG